MSLYDVKQKCLASHSTTEKVKDHAINHIGVPSISSLIAMVESTSIPLAFRVYPNERLDGFSVVGSIQNGSAF